MIQLMKRILKISGKYKKRIQIAFLFSFLKAMLKISPIMLSFLALSAFYQGSMDAEFSLWLGVGMGVCLLLMIVFQLVSDRLQSTAGYQLFADMRMDLGKHLRKMPMGYFTEGNLGKISSVISTDMLFIEENSMSVLADMMSFIFSQCVTVIFLCFLDLRLGLAAAILCIIISLIARGMNRDALSHSAVRQQQSENLTNAVLDFTEGIGIIKSYNLLGRHSRELTQNFEESCRANIAFEKNQAPWALTLYICYGLASVLVLAVAVFLFLTGGLSALYFIGMLLFVLELFVPIKALYSQATRLTVMNSCLDRIEQVFEEPELLGAGTQRIPHTYEGPEIVFKNVSFGYGEKEVLHQISFSLEKNQMMALVGPSGGGKSTIASLLARFWDIQQGEILIRGKNIKNIPLSELMDHISMVFQRVYLFQDTIYNNISIGRPDATREEVIEAAQKARCYDFIMALPDGFDTVIGEGGASLSGGEKQRLSIARCILKDAPIVILDEATANVDVDNESYIQQAISELCRGKTLLVIAHRLNTIRNADQIKVISNGRIVQSGRHEELVRQEGIYQNFVKLRTGSSGWSKKSTSSQD